MILRKQTLHNLVVVLILWWSSCLVHGYSAPFLKRKDMIGIWKVSKKVNHPYPNPSEIYKESLRMGAGYEDEVVLRLNEDGTFDPYTAPLRDDDGSLGDGNLEEDLHHLLGRGGRWEFRDHNLLLAADRPKTVKNLFTHKDTLFRGKPEAVVTTTLIDDESGEALQEQQEDIKATEKEDSVDVHLAIPQGQISSGKFLYPKKHNMFFDDPVLFKPSNLGFFFMNQLLGKLNAVNKPKPTDNNAPLHKFQPHDFYNRTFYLATAEFPVEERFIAQDKHCNPNENPLVDIRALEVTFYPNNTFAAVSTEKTLRGRFGITGPEGDQLWFQVSIFGAGRSVSGSVFSEGRLVSQHDKRGYLGPIQAYPNHNNQTTYYIYGNYFDGTPDLHNPQKQASAGTFILQEVDLDNDDCEVEEYYYDGYSSNPWEGEEDAFL